MNKQTKQVELKKKILSAVDFILSRPYMDIAMGDPLKAKDEMRRLMVLEIEKLIAQAQQEAVNRFEEEVMMLFVDVDAGGQVTEKESITIDDAKKIFEAIQKEQE